MHGQVPLEAIVCFSSFRLDCLLHLKSTCLACFFPQTPQIFFSPCLLPGCQHRCSMQKYLFASCMQCGIPWQGPRTARLEQHVPLPNLSRGLLSDWHLDNVLGDGRCGYRSLRRYRGVSFQRVLKRLLAILVESSLFPSSHIIDMMSVQDCSNTCPNQTSCLHVPGVRVRNGLFLMVRNGLFPRKERNA